MYQSGVSWALNRNPNLNLETGNPAFFAILRARWVWPFGCLFQLQHLAFSLLLSALLTTGCDFAKCRKFHCFLRADCS
jgi:hypothetical protein